MDLLSSYPRAVSMFLLGGGIALIIVPKWIRWAIAVVMIAMGLGELFPELLTNGT
ncbi:MAG: hypothetical protein V3V02_10025 [Rhizobiaceae bacterium]